MEQDYRKKQESLEECLERLEYRVKKIPEWMVALQDIYKEITESHVSYRNDLKYKKPKENC